MELRHPSDACGVALEHDFSIFGYWRLLGSGLCFLAGKIMPKLIERTKTLKVKNGMELDAEMGPIVTKAALERITGYIESVDILAGNAR